MNAFYDVLDLVNALMSSLVFCALIYKGRLFYEQYDGHQKSLWFSFTLYALTASYGSVESYAQNDQGGLRTILLLAANVVALYAFIRYHESAFGKRINGV